MINLRHVQIIVKLLRCVQQVKHDCSCYSLHFASAANLFMTSAAQVWRFNASEWIPQTQLIKPVAAILILSLSLSISLLFFYDFCSSSFVFFFACALMLPLATERKRRVVQIILYYYFFFCINLISAAYYQHELAAISQRLRQSAKQTIEVGWSSLARRHLPEECDSRIIILMISRGL